jgi:polysaccharide pyruvyl transferase WcaK-like protein
MMVSSRYHGIVTSMPGLVPSAGITMDERIRNLMRDRGHPEMLMNVDDPDLEAKMLKAMEILATEGDRIAEGIGRCVVRNLKVMARMGVYFEEEVQRRYPDFPIRKGEWNWQDYLPPMSDNLHRLIQGYN